MTKNEFDALPDVVKFAIKASHMSLDKIEVKDGKITFQMPEGVTDKSMNDEDCEHCPVRFVCPDSTIKAAVQNDIRVVAHSLSEVFGIDENEAMRAAASMFGLDDIDDIVNDDNTDTDDGNGFVDDDACKKAWTEMDPAEKDRIEKLIALDITDVDTLSKATGLNPAMCAYILCEHGVTFESDRGDKTFLVPITGFIAVEGASSEDIAIEIAKRVVNRVRFNANNVVNDTDEVYAAGVMNDKGDIDENLVCATCRARNIRAKAN